MKKNIFALLVPLLAILMSASCSKDDDNDNGGFHQSKMECVDLGLSVKWATCNLGATSPEDYGVFFAWGETKPKINYANSTYEWYKRQENKDGYIVSGLTKYCSNKELGYQGFTDGKTTLDLADDAARAYLGSPWRMPTGKELKELYESCSFTATEQNGAKGYLVKSKLNGNSIFLPCGGSMTGYKHENDYGYGELCYWSSTLGYILWGYGDLLTPEEDPYFYINRSQGLCIRPVCP